MCIRDSRGSTISGTKGRCSDENMKHAIGPRKRPVCVNKSYNLHWFSRVFNIYHQHIRKCFTLVLIQKLLIFPPIQYSKCKSSEISTWKWTFQTPHLITFNSRWFACACLTVILKFAWLIFFVCWHNTTVTLIYTASITCNLSLIHI